MAQLLNSCYIELVRKDIKLLSETAVILYIAASSKGVEGRHMKFTLSVDIWPTDDFNEKVKVAFLQQRQDWEAPHIKNLKPVIQEH